MALITQTPPASASVSIAGSDNYTAQLLATGATPPVTWTVTQPNPSLAVSPAGVLSTSGTLAEGPYTISGTMVDGALNTGVWAYTLTVRETLAPQTAVVPSTPASPLGIEMLSPFQINPATGGVAFLTNYLEIIEQHLIAIIMTAMGERVMLPTYGFGLETEVFNPIYSRTAGVLQNDIEAEINANEPAIQLQSVKVEQGQNSPNTLNISISYSVLPSNSTSTLTLSIGGGVFQVVS